MDLFALLTRGGLGGVSGLTWDAYLDTPDEILRDGYGAEFDDEHQLVPLGARRKQQKEDGGLTGNPEQAGRELPSREALAIPDAAWQVNPRLALDPFSQAFCLMTWSVWRRRQREGVRTETGEPITDAYILERWTALAGGK